MTDPDHSDSLGATLPGTAGEAGGTREAVPRPRGSLVDRYVITDVVGRGAMGVVYAAFDPELDRKVALKLLRPGRGHHGRRSQRLRQEAQALAQVSSPHVVSVFDVGSVDDEIYIAMEFVRGRTLDAWVAEHAGRWSEVLPVLVDAARGLSAAHSADLVHGDFKPTNVMVDDEGVARVLDFGLARRIEASASSPERAPPGPAGLVGTPAYMSPEHVRHDPVTPASDQFAFCVVAYEALFGVRPFAGETLGEIAHALLYDEPAPPPRGRKVPAWVRRAIGRGLARPPAARWPSMAALVGELTRDRTRRRRVLLAGGALALAAGAWGWSMQASDPARCQRRADEATAAWGQARRATVRASFRRAGASYGEDVADSVLAGVGEYVDGWRALYVETCSASREILPDDTRRRTMACLAERGRALEATLTALTDEGADVLGHGVQAVERLPPVTPCGDPSYLAQTRVGPDDPVQADAYRRLRERLAESDAASSLGRYEAARDVLTATVTEAEAFGHLGVLALAEFQLGTTQLGLNEQAEARRRLRDAYAHALTADLPRYALLSALQLVHLEGTRAGDVDRAREWAYHAGALVGRPEITDAERARYHAELAQLASVQLRSDDAVAHYRAALDLERRIAGDHALRVAVAQGSLGVEYRRRGEADRARELQEAALQTMLAKLGPDHPQLSPLYNNLGRTLLSQGETERGRGALRRAVEIIERSLPPGHLQLAYALTNISLVERDAGDYASALATCDRALRIREAGLPKTHPHIAYTLVDRADLLRRLERFEEARADLERAQRILSEASGPEHPGLAGPLTGLGRLHLAEGDPVAALEPLRRAWALRGRSVRGHDDGEGPTTAFSLAVAEWDAGGDRAEARALAEGAVAQLRTEPAAREGVLAEELAEMERWLKTHAPAE